MREGLERPPDMATMKAKLGCKPGSYYAPPPTSEAPHSQGRQEPAAAKTFIPSLGWLLVWKWLLFSLLRLLVQVL